MERKLIINEDTQWPEPSREGLIEFLSSPWIPGIGNVYARKLVDTYGKNVLEIFRYSLQDVSKETSLGINKVSILFDSLQKLKYPVEFLAFLYSCGLSQNDIDKILNHYKNLSPKVIAYDPYQMVEDVWKLSFFTADKIGRAMNIPKDDPRRIKGALLTSVKIFAENGNLFATPEEAVELTSQITRVDPKTIRPVIKELLDDQRLIESHGVLYLPVYYKAEKEGASRISQIINNSPIQIIDEKIPLTDRFGNHFSNEQLKAIETVLKSPVSIISGGPGTGKTTAMKGIIDVLTAQGKKIIMAAPTGRAAKRMTDLTGYEAKTLHRLLGYRQGEGYRNKKLDADVLIVDEASMLEQVIFNHLLQALPLDLKIVLVGDPDQLPPIGAGDVLKQMIASHKIPVISLQENFRQEDGSDISQNAFRIKHGITPFSSKPRDFLIVEENSTKKIKEKILSLVSDEIPGDFNISSNQIQIVTPQQEGPLGAKQLNLDIQEKINPSGPQIKKGTKIFRLNDRVMQTSNSSEKEVYNGETGWISNINETSSSLEVTFFDGKTLKYGYKELSELSLAYAMTVHKLQGCETDYMVMPLTMGHKPMLYRNLLYTAVSRARKLCVLVGENEAIETAVKTSLETTRNSLFAERLKSNIRS